MEKTHAWLIQSGFFQNSGRGYSEDQIRNYIIQKGFTGLRKRGGGARVKRLLRVKGVCVCVFFKGKGWINRINKAGFLCLSSALSVSIVNISVLLNASPTANQISRIYREYFFSCHVDVTACLPRLYYYTVTVISTVIVSNQAAYKHLTCLRYLAWY